MRILPIHWDGPIALAAATAASSSALAQWGPITLAGAGANYFTLAHYFSGRCCQCTLMGPLHQQMLLPMHSDGPIASADAAANYFTLAHFILSYFYQLHHI